MNITTIKPQVAYEGSYYTIAGCGGDLSEWVAGYTKALEEAGIGTPKAWYTLKGEDVNRYAGFGHPSSLHPDDCFHDDLTFLLFPLDGLDVGRLAMFKLSMMDRWFDDIIDNMR